MGHFASRNMQQNFCILLVITLGGQVVTDIIAQHQKATANALGLDELRTGRHICRDDDRTRIGELWCPYFWTIRAIPTFNEHVMITVVEMEGRDSPRFKTKGWRKAAISAEGEFEVLTNVSRNVEPCLDGLQLLLPSGNLTLDGILYEFAIQSVELRGTFSFGNPNNAGWALLANECRKLGESLAKQARNPILLQHMAQWKVYAEDA